MSYPKKAASFAVKTDGSTVGECVVRVQGDLDWATHHHLEDALAPLLQATGLRHLVLDLSAVSYIDSAGLAALVQARRALWDRGGQVVLRCCPPVVHRALNRTRLISLFDMAPAASLG